jgi:hypothetical protein
MYLTFEQAMRLIKPKGAKNKNYYMSRITQLIKLGFLEEAFPKIYIKSGDDFINISAKCERLVTYHSVNKYIENRKKAKETFGVIPKKNRQIKAVFLDDSFLKFDSIQEACSYFDISRFKINKSLKDNKTIEVRITNSRRQILFIEDDIETELVRFY